MPLEIRELVIKVNIEEHTSRPAGNNLGARELQALKDKVVRECMEKLITNIENLSVR